MEINFHAGFLESKKSMKRNKMENVKKEQPIKISVQILPFGQMRLNYFSSGKKIETKERFPVYIGPPTTNIERIEILYGEERGYKIPETTAGEA